ncbi:MAG: hypothetical protein ACLVBI_09130 [Dialister invisus]|uniref:hypothetical protein n=1 Tax=Dialister invisus TaxID=218538 RepID=UPI00399B4987
MNKYLSVTNAKNETIIIDDKYNNLALTRKIKLTDCNITKANADKLVPYFDDLYKIEVVLNDKEYACAIGRSNKDFRIARVPVGFGLGDVYLFDEHKLYYFANEKDLLQDVYFYVFGDIPSTHTNGKGIQVFNSGGKCIFDSDYKYMNVLHAGTDDFALSDVNGKDFAIVQNGVKSIYEVIWDSAEGLTDVTLISPCIQNNNVTRTEVFSETRGMELEEVEYRREWDTYSYLLLDVTGY